MTDQAGVPEVNCLGCNRTVACIRVSDGTIYKPTTWVYTLPRHPLFGMCPSCQIAQATHGERTCNDPACAWCAETQRLATL